MPRCPHHPFPKSHGNPKSMNKLTLNEPAITMQVNVPFIFVMVLKIHEKPWYLTINSFTSFSKKIACAETAELRMMVSYTTYKWGENMADLNEAHVILPHKTNINCIFHDYEFPKQILYSEHKLQRITCIYKFSTFSMEVLCNCKH